MLKNSHDEIEDRPTSPAIGTHAVHTLLPLHNWDSFRTGDYWQFITNLEEFSVATDSSNADCNYLGGKMRDGPFEANSGYKI